MRGGLLNGVGLLPRKSGLMPAGAPAGVSLGPAADPPPPQPAARPSRKAIAAARRLMAPYGERLAIAVRIPCRIAVGGGGQPGTATSTGMISDTPPQVA